MRCYVLMGVSGCGKSSVGLALAEQCAMTFIDGDDLHPKSNIAKMSSGTPLTDEDRRPWLQAVGEALKSAPGPVVIGCSALKKRYREIIRDYTAEPVYFLHLHATVDVLQSRVNERADHFMPASLLQSQFDALEHLSDDEAGARIDIAQPLADVISQTKNHVQETLS